MRVFGLSKVNSESRRADSNRLPLISFRVIGHALQWLANAAYLKGFPFAPLLRLHRIAFPMVSEWYQCDPRVDPRLRVSFAWPLGLLSVEGTLSSMLGQPLALRQGCRLPGYLGPLPRGAQAEPSGVVGIDPTVFPYQPRCRCRRLLPSTGSPAAIHAFLPSPYSRTFA